MPEEAVSALKTFLAHYMILRVYTVMHNNTRGLPTIQQNEKVAGGGGGGGAQTWL